jgi:hypothetical protein
MLSNCHTIVVLWAMVISFALDLIKFLFPRVCSRLRVVKLGRNALTKPGRHEDGDQSLYKLSLPMLFICLKAEVKENGSTGQECLIKSFMTT